jgi:hypothetical protein
MTKPMIRIHNTETNEVIDREMTTEEFKNYEAEQSLLASAEAEKEAKIVAKNELLAKLGITQDEAVLLLS